MENPLESGPLFWGSLQKKGATFLRNFHKCLNTILRHIQADPDKYDVCLLENLIACQALHRMGSLYGNESLAVLASLTNQMFIQPSALGRDYLKEE